MNACAKGRQPCSPAGDAATWHADSTVSTPVAWGTTPWYRASGWRNRRPRRWPCLAFTQRVAVKPLQWWYGFHLGPVLPMQPWLLLVYQVKHLASQPPAVEGGVFAHASGRVFVYQETNVALPPLLSKVTCPARPTGTRGPCGRQCCRTPCVRMTLAFPGTAVLTHAQVLRGWPASAPTSHSGLGLPPRSRLLRARPGAPALRLLASPFANLLPAWAFP